MNIVIAKDLDWKSEKELCALFQRVSQEMVKSDRHSPARRNALASLENINRAINTRRIKSYRPKGF